MQSNKNLALTNNEIGLNFSKLSPEQLDGMFNMILGLKMQKNEESLEKLSLELKSTSEELRTDLNKVKETTKNLAEKNHFIQHRAYGDEYINVSLLGAENEPKISNVRMNKLLCVVGITLKNSHSTPKTDAYTGKNPLVQRKKVCYDGKGETWQYLYHRERTWKIIKDRLNKMEKLDGFITATTKDDIDEIIDDMFDSRQ